MPHLMEMNILSAVDGEALRRYCEAFAHWKRYQAVLVKQAVDLGDPKYARGLKLYRNLWLCFTEWMAILAYRHRRERPLRCRMECRKTIWRKNFSR